MKYSLSFLLAVGAVSAQTVLLEPYAQCKPILAILQPHLIASQVEDWTIRTIGSASPVTLVAQVSFC
jgi:hypothetical protein